MNVANLRRMRDSLILVSSLQRSIPKNSIKARANNMQTFDFVSEPITETLISKMSMPVDGKLSITSGFGNRIHPVLGFMKMHNGIDIAVSYQRVKAVLDGVVSNVGYDAASGNFMKIRHSEKYETAYLHLSEIYYKPGERVNAGYVIGRSGNSGRSTGPHLHFAVKENGQYICLLYTSDAADE